ncbi:MAG: MBL fold metallo-hydrolase [Saprospiraceae bacterium]
MPLSNPELPIICDEWQGNPISPDGRFYHPEYPFALTWADILKWKSKPNPYRAQKKRDTWQAPVVKDDSFLRHGRNVMVWLGHASFFFRLNGVSILIDPVFGKLSPFMPRHSGLPVAPEKFRNLDLILVTHDHRDHCDAKSLRLLAQNNPKAHIVTGLNMPPLLRRWTNGHRITDMGWFQQFEVADADLKITYLPTRHWCRRWLTDTNRRLWGAFVLQTKDLTIYFGGDSGYGSHFRQTAELFPKIDYAILGIGAFAPEWFMHTNHMSPHDAMQAFRDLRAGKLVSMHYGTFDLSDEPLGEPLRLMREIAGRENATSEMEFLKIGENSPLDFRLAAKTTESGKFVADNV